MPSKLNAQARLKLIERVILKKESVAKICRENGISRVIFYRWLKRYLEAEKSVKSLEPKAKTEATVVNRVTPEQEAQILEIVIENPDLSCKGIYNELPKDSSGKPLVGYHGVQNVLERLHLSTKDERIKYGQNISKTDAGVPEYNYLTPEQKMAMLNRVLNNKEQVSDVCKEYGLSRTAFYKLKNRYLQTSDENKEKVLVRKKSHVDRYWRQTPEEYERAVFDLVGKHPEYGIRNLLTNLPQIGGVPIVSHHGIQNILRRNNLSLYEQRLVYAKAQVTPFTRFVQQFEMGFAKFFVLPQETRTSLVRFISTLSFSTLATIIILGGLGYLTTISGGISVFLKPGMIFASLSLLMGTIFLAYSMKYYFSLALVLSFSSGGGVGENGESGGVGGWLKRIFGSSAQQNSVGGTHPVLNKAGGLEANLDHIKLERYPFISIHLPFYNEKKVANRIISACTSMDYPNFEVIVCDDSTDETINIIDEWKNHPRVKILHRPTREGFKGGALSYALKSMDPKTEFVCVFDADFVPYPDSLMQFVKYFKATGGWKEDKNFEAGSVMTMPYSTFGDEVPNEEVSKEGNVPKVSNGENIFARQEEELRAKGTTAVVAGYQWHVLNKSENWITRGVRTEYSGSYVIERPAQEIMGAFKIIHGSVYCMRADVLKHFGWGTSITEDYEMTLRIYEKGFKVCYTPYIQAPSECVSTIKRLIRQRMRWAEGHSFNTRKMFSKLMFGSWRTEDGRLMTDDARLQAPPPDSALTQSMRAGSAQADGGQGRRKTENQSSKKWIPSPLTLPEKIEFAYLAPYYLQAFFFIIGTMGWLLSEVVFKTRLPFWTALWGWSLVLTNFFAMPLLNGVGLFLEEAEEKDYLGTFSFIALSYLLVPFQAYAAIKGFIEDREGPWFRTPKTGTITDVFTRGRFYRWLTGILNWKPTVAPSASLRAMVGRPALGVLEQNVNPYLALASANNQFSNFKIRPRHFRLIGNAVFSLFIFLTAILVAFSPLIAFVQPTQAQSPGKLVTVEQAMSEGNNQEEKIEEIDTPRQIRFTNTEGKDIELIFHKEPRVRLKFGEKEMEITTLEIEGLGKVLPKRSLLVGENEVRYEEIVEGVDLVYSASSRGFEEKFIVKKPLNFDGVVQRVNVKEVKVIGPNSDVFGFYDENNKEVFTFTDPWMKEAGVDEKERGIKMTLEKDTLDWKLKKTLTSQGKQWFSDPSRQFPIVIDPTTIVGSGTTEGVASYGANQRKIVYSTTSSAWYVVYESPGATADLGDVVYYKSLNGTSWAGPTDIDSTDCTAQESGPSTWLEGALIYVVWNTRNCAGVTGTDDALVYITIDTTVDGTPDSLGTRCSTADLATIGATDQNSIAVVGTNVFMVNDNDPDFMRTTTSCGAPAAVATGHVVTATDRPVLVEFSGTLHVFFQDAQLSWSRCADGVCDAAGDWTPANQTIDATASTVFSVTTDDTNIWILAISSSTAAVLYTCAASCDALSDWGSPTPLTTPFTGLTNLTAVSITYDTVNADLYAHAIYETNEIAYFRKADNPTSPSWDGPWTYGQSGTGDYLGYISSPMTVTASSQVGVVLRNTATYEFATVPEKSLILLILSPLLPGALKKIRERRRRKA